MLLTGKSSRRNDEFHRCWPEKPHLQVLAERIKEGHGPEDLTIITFNYDLIFERVLELIDVRGRDGTFWFPGCYRMDGIARIQNVSGQPEFKSEEYAHEGVAVLKLHGSVNWQSNHTSSSPTSAAMLNPNRELHVLDSTMISLALSWRRKRRTVHMKPIIVPL